MSTEITTKQEIDQEQNSNSLVLVDVGSLVNLPDAKQIQKIAENYKALMAAACTVLSSSDIINIDGNPFIEHLGCKKIAGLMGLVIRANERDGKIDYQKIITDENTGDYYISVMGKVFFANNPDLYEIYEGTCKAMHGFFDSIHKGDVNNVQLVPVTRVQEKAMANFMQRALKKKIGLKFTWEELEQYSGLKKASCKGYDHKNSSAKSSDDSTETADLRKKSWDMLAEMYGGNKEEIENWLELITKGEVNGKQIQGKRDINKLSEAQITKFIYPKVKKMHEDMYK